MLHLQTGVHLHEVEPVRPKPVGGINDELNGARAFVPNRLGSTYGSLPHRGTHLRGHSRRGGFFNHLLVAALERAITFKQMHHICAVTKHLHLDMARCVDVLFYENSGVAKRRCGLPLCAGQRIGKILGPVHAPHPLATATSHGFDQHRIADFSGAGLKPVLGRAVIPRHHGDASLHHQGLGRVLQTHRPDCIR